MKKEAEVLAAQFLERRSFLGKTGKIGLAAAAALTVPGLGGGATAFANIPGNGDNLSGDTALEIFTAALIAEDLATTFYYNGLVGGVITDPNLAGTGGTATSVAADGDGGNVDYIRAALSEEMTHANLLRTLIGGKSAAGDPVQTFYFANGIFDSLTPFLATLEALENAFIGAYLNATIEFAEMAADTRAGGPRQKSASGTTFTSRDLEYFAQVAACIMGIESEHRVLGRDIGGMRPANQLNYEQTDTLTSVYNGPHSAVVALTPFLGPGGGKIAYSLQTAVEGAPSVSLATMGGLPPAPPPRRDD